MNGAILAQYPTIYQLQTADFNGDGMHDIAVDDGGEFVIRLIQGTTTLASGPMPSRPGPAFAPNQCADLNGDKRADIVLWTELGETMVYLMDGLTVKSITTVLISTDWYVAFPADFNGDGKSDLVWRNYITGETAIWLMDGANYLSGTIVMVNSFWTASPAGDLDGDGKDDLAWHNNVTGETALWLMDGTSMKAGAIVVTDGNWTARHFGDLNGDRRSDIIWENGVTKATHVWLMQGLTMAAGGPIPLNGASVIVVDDFDGDGRDDLVTADGQLPPGFTTYSLWLMDGLNVSSMAALMYTNYWVLVPVPGVGVCCK